MKKITNQLTIILLIATLASVSLLFTTDSYVPNYFTSGTPPSLQSVDLPLCTDGMMDKRRTDSKSKKNEYSYFPLNLLGGGCRLHWYKRSDLQTCIEALGSIITHKGEDKSGHTDNNITNASHNNITANNKAKIRVAFVGDSRIRHMYGNFMNMLVPFYEERNCPQKRPVSQNGSVNAATGFQNVCLEVPLLDSYFAFHWIPGFRDEYFELLQEWIEGKSLAPNYLVTGSTIWNMPSIEMDAHAGRIHNTSFEGTIRKLMPLLNQLSERHNTRIVWWSDDLPLLKKHRQAVIELNKMTRQIIEETKVSLNLWDSTNDLFMDYVRTCDDDRTVENDAYGRKAHHYLPIKWKTNKYSWINWANPTSWINCFDSVHSPQAYVMNQMQLIVNDLCNGVMDI